MTELEDEVIECNNKKFSLKRCLGDEAWSLYCTASEKVKELVKLKVFLDLSELEIGLAKIDKIMGNFEENLKEVQEQK